MGEPITRRETVHLSLAFPSRWKDILHQDGAFRWIRAPGCAGCWLGAKNDHDIGGHAGCAYQALDQPCCIARKRQNMHINPAQMPVRRLIRVPIPFIRRQQETADSFCKACSTVFADDQKCGRERMRRSDP